MRSILYLMPLMLLFTGCSVSDLNVKNLLPKKEKPIITTKQGKNPLHKKVSPYVEPSNGVYHNLDDAIVSMANQLFKSNTDKKKMTSIILTSFADLNSLNKTTTFGRLLSESMFNELHIRKFHVTDFRGQDAVSVNRDGEFHITRDVEKLKDHISATEYILVGTYVKFEKSSVLVNARIIDSETGSIISTARVVYKPTDCSLFDLCPKPVEEPFGINIIEDKCAGVDCPTQKCKDGICDNSTLY